MNFVSNDVIILSADNFVGTDLSADKENVLLLIERTQGKAIQQNPFKMNVKDFIMTLHWLKSYNTEPEIFLIK